MSERKHEHNRILALEEENFHLNERIHNLELENYRLKRLLEKDKDSTPHVIARLKQIFT